MPNDHTYRCPICKDRFATRKIRDSHILMHEDADKFECDQCHKVFNRAYKVVLHRQSVHDPERSSERPLPGKVGDLHRQSTHTNERPFGCKVCPERFKHQIDRETHFLKMHSEKMKKPYCEICGKLFATNSTLKEHFIVHSREKPFRCADCPSRFARKSDYKRHQNEIHGERRFPCGGCGYPFTRKYQLEEHLQKKSRCTGSRTGSSEGKFVRLENLRRRQLHKEKTFDCDRCGMQFAEERAHREHLRTHSNNRFDCVQCGDSFKLYKHLQKHLTRHSISRREASEQRRLARGNDREEFGVNGKNPNGSVGSSGAQNSMRVKNEIYRADPDDVDSDEADESSRSPGCSEDGSGGIQEGDDELSEPDKEPDDRMRHSRASSNLKVIFDVEYRAPD